MSETIQRRFNALRIKNALVADFVFDLGEEFSVKLFPDPKTLELGGTLEKYALRFSCIRDVRFELQTNQAAMQILSHSANYPSEAKGTMSAKTRAPNIVRFALRLTGGQLNIEAEDFSLTVIQRMQIADRYIDQ